MFVQTFVGEYQRYRTIADKAIAQVHDDADFNRILAPNGNSIAMLMRHVGGNFTSRFTDFLSADGEKPWRNRDTEFSEGPFARADVDQLWTSGWNILMAEVGKLADE